MLTGKSVLIVEDAALIAVDLEMVLAELGADPISTQGGGESTTQSSYGPYDLAVVDIRTAASLANDLVGELDAKGIPVVFLTTDPEGKGIPAYSGASAIVMKPFTYEDLCAAIARLIG